MLFCSLQEMFSVDEQHTHKHHWLLWRSKQQHKPILVRNDSVHVSHRAHLTEQDALALVYKIHYCLFPYPKHSYIKQIWYHFTLGIFYSCFQLNFSLKAQLRLKRLLCLLNYHQILKPVTISLCFSVINMSTSTWLEFIRVFRHLKA